MDILRKVKNKVIRKQHRKRLKRILKVAKDKVIKHKESVYLKHILLEHYGLNKFSYLDVGCNDPVVHSYTYDFYKSGINGVCIDANPLYVDKFEKMRPKDTFINVGITTDNDGDEKDFHIMSNKVSSTFDPQWAKDASIHHNLHIEDIIKVKLRRLNSIIQEYFGDSPDLLLLDLEGLDFEVIQSMDFKKYRPKVIMMETTALPYTAEGAMVYGMEVAKFLNTKNYYWFSRIHENSVFIDKETYKRKSVFSLV